MRELGCLMVPFWAIAGLVLLMSPFIAAFADPLSPLGLAGWAIMLTVLVLVVRAVRRARSEVREQRMAERQRAELIEVAAYQRELVDEVRYYLAVVEDHAYLPGDTALTMARLCFNQIERKVVGWQAYRELERRLERAEAA